MLRQCHLIVLLTILCGMRPADRACAQNTATFAGDRIVNISFEPEHQPLEGRELFELLPLKRNDTYQAAAVRTAIERLYATGRYEDIQVDTGAVSGGVNVRFITRNTWFTGNVSAESDFAEPPSRGQIVNASRLHLGEPFDPAQIPPALAGIRKLLVDNGYFEPEIEPSYRYDDAFEQVHVTFTIRTGKRARYSEPKVIGDVTVLTKEDIVKATGWRRFLRPGYSGITATGTRRGIDKIRLKYTNSGRVLATVVLNGIDQLSVTRGEPAITVSPGPRVDILTTGAKVPKKVLRETIPVFEEHAIDPDLLAEGTTNLRSYFQALGYFDAEVSVPGQKLTAESTEIDYTVKRGSLHRLVQLDISGNKYFDGRTIRERMFIAPKSFENRRGRYSEAYRRRDTEAIQALYESNGFRDAKVTSRTVDNYLGRTGDIAVIFAIDEGPQYTVSTLEIKGSRGLDLTKAVESLSSQAGQPFSEFNVAADRQNIIGQYGDHGYPRATFEWDAKPGPAPHTFALEFTINEGQQQTVREVVISGLRTTQPELVNRQILLNPGSPLSPVAMAETQRRLGDLGIFAQVNMAIQNPDGAESRKYVLYDLEEASRYSLTAAPGFEFGRIGGSNAVTDLSDPGGGTGISPRISVALTRINFRGRGESLNFQGRLSNFQKRALVRYLVPKPFNHASLDAAFSVLYDDTHDVRTFQSKREEASAQLSQHVSKPITAFYRFTYRHVGVGSLKIDPLLVPRIAQSVRVGIASVNLSQDRRDDPLDPHKGIYNTLDAGFATKAFGSQTSFVRLLGRNATYYRLGQKVVFARETQAGIQPAFSIPAGADPNDPIPLPERFFGGGGNTHRGFPENQAGPRDTLTGFPLGGSALFFNSAELRFPLLGANINGVLFEDAGNIYSSLSKISFATTQKSLTDFNYMVHAVGFGIRYRTPVGPLRLDLAYSINPPRFNGFPGSYADLVQCSVNGTCQSSRQRIGHLQFFFSIGQAF